MPAINIGEIRAHVEILHALATPLAGAGKLVVACFAQDPDQPHPKTGNPGRPLPPTIAHIDIGDIERNVRVLSSVTERAHYNTYMPLAVLRQELPAGRKGEESDVAGVLGFVADFDDAEAHCWADRLPVPPQYVLATSAGRFQAFYLFDRSETIEAAKAIAGRLKTFAGCDHGTADLSHIWRVPGSLNWPNARKIAAGRSPDPQLVRVTKPWTGEAISLSALAAALPDVQRDLDNPELQAPNSGKVKGCGGVVGGPPKSDRLAEVMRSLPSRLHSQITEPETGDRSKALFHVIGKLSERGFDSATIELIIRAHPGGIGAKYAQRRDLNHEIARVQAKITRRTGDAGPVSKEAGRPVIRVAGGTLPHSIDEAEQHLLAAGRDIYQRGAMIVRPAQTRIPIADTRQTFGMRLVPVKLHHLIETFTAVADFQRFDKKSKEWVSMNCPRDVAAAYLERDGEWRLPTLTGITHTPTLRPDGSPLDRPGYDSETGILYDPIGATFPPIPKAPTKEQAISALAELKRLVSTFPFTDDASRAVALSGILTAVIRRSIPSAPLHAFTAPTAGSGKSLLVDIASVISTGREAAVIAQGKTEEEMEKRLGAALIAGDGMISIDNCERPLGGELLSQALTQPLLKIRILGKSLLSEMPSNSAIFATGNNLSIIGDMSRRAIVCSLDPDCERPELREFDTHPLHVIRKDRALFVLAALTVLRAFDVAGRPRQCAPLGSFEGWSAWVRDALVWCGEIDVVTTIERSRQDDPKLEALANVVHQWDTAIGDRRVSASEVIDIATTMSYGVDTTTRKFVNDPFRDALLVVAGDGGAISSRRLGKWLASIKGRIVAGKRIAADGIVAGIARWKLERRA
jgi:hypothetical protein